LKLWFSQVFSPAGAAKETLSALRTLFRARSASPHPALNHGEHFTIQRLLTRRPDRLHRHGIPGRPDQLKPAFFGKPRCRWTRCLRPRHFGNLPDALDAGRMPKGNRHRELSPPQYFLSPSRGHPRVLDLRTGETTNSCVARPAGRQGCFLECPLATAREKSQTSPRLGTLGTLA